MSVGRKILLVITSVFLLISLFIFLSADALINKRDDFTSNPIKFQVQDNDLDAQTIRCWDDEEQQVYYAFLPSYASLGNITLQYNMNKYQIKLNDQTIESGSNMPSVELEKAYSITIQNKHSKKIEQRNIIFMQGGHTAALFIDTDSGNMENIEQDKSYKEPSKMQLIDEMGNIHYNGELNFIKGRGNSTWVSQKKPYNIQLSNAASLLNMGKSNNWVLLANSNDHSFIRNKIIYDFAKEVGLKYSPSSEFVDLYLNGEYAGIYQLCEKMEVGENRVEISNLEEATRLINDGDLRKYKSYKEYSAQDEYNPIKSYSIENNPTDLSGGYLMSLDYIQRYANEKSGFITKKGQPVVIKSPEHTSREQAEYISGLVNEFEESLYDENGLNNKTGKYFYDYIDLDSWIKKYLIEEIFENQDAGSLSQYFYKDSDTKSNLIFAGPVWDYDLSIGNGEPLIQNPNTLIVNQRDTGGGIISKWYPKLYEKEVFYHNLTQMYKEFFKPQIQALLDSKLNTYREAIKASAKMDTVRWRAVKKNGRSFEQDINYIKQYLESREDFLDQVWIRQKVYYSVRVNMEDISSRYLFFSVEQGKSLSTVDLEIRGHKIKSLYDEESNKPYDVTSPVIKDITLYERRPIDRQWIKQFIKQYDYSFFVLVFLGVLVCLIGVDLYRRKKYDRGDVKNE